MAQMHDPLVGVLLALTIVIGVGVLILLVMLAGLGIAAMKTRKKLHTLIQQYETQVAPQVGPMAQKARELVDDLSPKIKHIAANVSDISDKVREETQRITTQVNDVVERTHQQAARVDHMVSSTLNGIGHATSAVQEGISAPIRHLSGVIEGLRAGLGSLFRKEKHQNHHRTDFSTPDGGATAETTVRSETTALARPVDVEPIPLTYK
jgi:methyl-accepting chemotaxis protein